MRGSVPFLCLDLYNQSPSSHRPSHNRIFGLFVQTGSVLAGMRDDSGIRLDGPRIKKA